MIARFVEIMSYAELLCVVDTLICGVGDDPIENLPHWLDAILASTDPS